VRLPVYLLDFASTPSHSSLCPIHVSRGIIYSPVYPQNHERRSVQVGPSVHGMENSPRSHTTTEPEVMLDRNRPLKGACHSANCRAQDGRCTTPLVSPGGTWEPAFTRASLLARRFTWRPQSLVTQKALRYNGNRLPIHPLSTCVQHLESRVFGWDAGA